MWFKRKYNIFLGAHSCRKTVYFSGMKAASVHELKTELSNTPQPQLVELCVRLARFKKENKELITYLLFESFDEHAWVENIKKEMQEQFDEMNKNNVYFVKKSLRKILRVTGKYIRYTGSAEVEVRLLLAFCGMIKTAGISTETNPVIRNLYQNQLKKISRSVAGMHEDLQYDYLKELKLLS